MKKEALELVRRIYHLLKWDIPHPNLEEIFLAARNQARFFAQYMAEKDDPKNSEKYDLLVKEINKIEDTAFLKF
jgi:hypothetical protein